MLLYVAAFHVAGGVIQVPMTMPTQSSAGTASSAVPTAAAVALPNGTTTNANGQLVLVWSIYLFMVFFIFNIIYLLILCIIIINYIIIIIINYIIIY